MNSAKIYPLFLKKFESVSEDEEFRVIISFMNTSNRDSFITKYENLTILNKFHIIPSICVKIKKDLILKLKNEELIKLIEEDQELILSILEINEILALEKVKSSQISFMGKDVRVGIIDNGVNDNFESISNVTKIGIRDKKFKKWKDDDISHGTIMASIIGNQLKVPGYGMIGIAPNVKIVDLDISNPEKKYFFSSVLEILDQIVKKDIKIDILLISLTTSHTSDGMDILSSACNLLVDKGFIIICPAGNFGPNEYTIGSPSAAKNVITFGSLEKDLKLSRFSGKGPTIDKRMKPDFCLPGSQIKIPLTPDQQINVTGSSVAAAIGVGIIALIKEYKPEISHKEIYDQLINSCRDLNINKSSQGFGMPQVTKFFENLGLIQEKILPYNFLIKRAVVISIEFSIILIVVFYLFYFFHYFRVA
ncbi:MAG: S8 family serine peptidase [Promethearchaeota archaeon]